MNRIIIASLYFLGGLETFYQTYSRTLDYELSFYVGILWLIKPILTTGYGLYALVIG